MSKIDKYNPEIAEKIRSGIYYKEAWDWYALKYIYPVSQRTFFIFISVAAMFVTISSLVILYNFYPLKVRVPVVVTVGDMTQDYAQLTKITIPENTDPTPPVMEYLVRRYVEKIESYNFRQIDRQLTFLKQFTTPVLMKEIEKRYDTRNLDSLVLLYRDHTTRTVQVTNYTVAVGEGFDLAKAQQKDIVLKDVPYRAIVDFESEEVNLLGTTPRKWRAALDITMSPVIYDRAAQKFQPLDFRVTSYSVSPIQ